MTTVTNASLIRVSPADGRAFAGDEDYRAILARTPGVSSAKELTNRTVRQ